MPRELIIDDTGEKGVTPNPGGQAAFAADWTHRMVAAEGGWMSGKTWLGARKLLTLHIHNSFKEDGTPTFVPSVALAPTYQNFMDYCMPNLESACCEAGLSFRYDNKKNGLILPDLGTRNRKSLIMIRSAERPKRITGWEVGAAWGDEASRWPTHWTEPERDSWLQLMGRVRHPDANFTQAIFTYTNEGDTTRMYEEFHLKPEKKDRIVYKIKTSENPKALQFYKDQKEVLNDQLVEQYLEGGVALLKGQRAYPEFNAVDHTVMPILFKEQFPLDLSVDWNINPGMHALLGQFDPEKNFLWTNREIHERRMSVKGVVAYLDNFFAKHGFPWPVLDIYGDATGRSGWAGTGQSSYNILDEGIKTLAKKYGFSYRFHIPKSNPFVTDRINAVNVALRDLKDRIYWKIDKRCKRLITDLRRVKLNDKGDIDKTDPEIGHSSDAEGYRISILRPIRRRKIEQTQGRVIIG